MYWYGFVTGVIAAYATPVIVCLGALTIAAIKDWWLKGSRQLDPYSRSVEDNWGWEDDNGCGRWL